MQESIFPYQTIMKKEKHPGDFETVTPMDRRRVSTFFCPDSWVFVTS